ncbi:hypothetical protein Tco_0817534, partial [Tanacetum coccineum]
SDLVNLNGTAYSAKLWKSLAEKMIPIHRPLDQIATSSSANEIRPGLPSCPKLAESVIESFYEGYACGRRHSTNSYTRRVKKWGGGDEE